MADLGVLVDAVVVAYDAAVSDAAWLRRIQDTLAPAFEPRAMEAWFCEHAQLAPVTRDRDAVTLHACDVDGRGLALQFLAPTRAPAELHLERLTAHLIAAARLRRCGGWLEAVLTPDGKLSHAEGDALYMREELREAARTIQRARTRLRTTAPEDALAGWRVLVEARWSLVDMVDSDGKPLVVARVNAPRTRASELLATHERQIVALAGRGHGHRLIAYELGLSEGLVAAHAAAALKKLGACA